MPQLLEIDESVVAGRSLWPRRHGGFHPLFLARMALIFCLGAGLWAVLGNVVDSIKNADTLLYSASLPWLAGGLGAEFVCYLFIGQQLGRLLGRFDCVGPTVPFRLGLVVYGFGSLLPGSPAPGFALAAEELRRRDVPWGRLAMVLGWCSWFNMRSFLMLALLTALSATLRGRVPQGTQDLVLGTAGVVILGLYISSFLIARPALVERGAAWVARLPWGRFGGDESRVRQWANDFHTEAMEVAGSRRHKFVVIAFAFGSWAADAICLRLALIAVGVHVPMGIILIAYVTYVLSAMVPLLPGGLGLVEATVPAVLHYYGVPLDAALAGTLAWRLLALLLPALAGLAALLSLRIQPVPHGGEATGSG